jgi:hypothetical protein
MQNLSLTARSFYFELMSDLISCELKKESRLRFYHCDMHKLRLEYEFDQMQFKTEFVINKEKSCIEVVTSRVLDTSPDAPITYRAIRSLDLTYKQGLMSFVHPYLRDVSCSQSVRAKQFVSSFIAPTGFFGQIYLAAVVECFLWVAV